MTDKIDTGKLKDVVRPIIRDELKDLIGPIIEETMASWKSDTGVVTESEVVRVVESHITPLRQDLDGVMALVAQISEINKELAQIKSGVDSIKGATTFIQQFAEDLRQQRESQDRLEARVTTNELALKTVAYQAEAGAAGAANIQLMIWGDPDNPSRPSLWKDIQNTIHNATSNQTNVLMANIFPIKAAVDRIAPMVERNTAFIDRRKEFEAMALSAFGFAKNLWANHRALTVTILGGSASVAGVAFLKAILEGLQ